MFRLITLFRVSRNPKQCTRIFKVSNTWTSVWNKKMGEKAGVKKQNSKKKDSKRMSSLKRGGNFSGFRFHCPTPFSASPSLMLAGPTQTNQS